MAIALVLSGEDLDHARNVARWAVLESASDWAAAWEAKDGVRKAIYELADWIALQRALEPMGQVGQGQVAGYLDDDQVQALLAAAAELKSLYADAAEDRPDVMTPEHEAFVAESATRVETCRSLVSLLVFWP